MIKLSYLLLLFVISNSYASEKKVICQIYFNVPKEMDRSIDKRPLSKVIEAMSYYDNSEKRVLKKYIIGEIKDTFEREDHSVIDFEVVEKKEVYYVLDTNGISVSARKSSCLPYSKKLVEDIKSHEKKLAQKEKIINKKENIVTKEIKKTEKKEKRELFADPKKKLKEVKEDLPFFKEARKENVVKKTEKEKNNQEKKNPTKKENNLKIEEKDFFKDALEIAL